VSGTSPDDDSAVLRSGPWTFRFRVTAECSRCGASPLSRRTRLPLHFPSPEQAALQLSVRGWRYTLKPGWLRRKKETLLCPACSAADVPSARPRKSAGRRSAGDTSWRISPGQPGRLPPNTRVPLRPREHP
jgi:hypothetical protein